MRVGPWRGDDRIAFVAPVSTTAPLPPALVDTCLTHLHRQGYDRAVTSAIAEKDIDGFLRAGFVIRERLHLLRHDLRTVGPTSLRATRRARRRDHDAVLRLDARAFDEFWRLDHDGLHEAIAATPISRFRVVGGEPQGYAIFGRAGGRGYLQRLAVDPTVQGRGLGTTLVNDGLDWLRRRAVRSVHVNTQLGNHGALDLYRRLGFESEPYGLVVLEVRLDEADAATP